MNAKEAMPMEWLPALREALGADLERQTAGLRERQPMLQEERRTLQAKCQGWTLSLSNPDLALPVRTALERDWEEALARIGEIDALLAESDARLGRLSQILDPTTGAANLQRLRDALASNNPTLGNLELSLHIDQISCDQDGRIVLRICKLGAFPEALQVVADRQPPDLPAEQTAARSRKGKPRRRARLHTDPLAHDAADLKDAAYFAADPERFASLADCWFWEDTFEVPAKTCWASEHAAEVARLRASMTMEQLAAHFSKSIPTIRRALRIAGQTDEEVKKLPKKRPRRRWAEDHAVEVATLKRTTGMSIAALARHFAKSDPTIRAALRHAADAGGPTFLPETDKTESPSNGAGNEQ